MLLRGVSRLSLLFSLCAISAVASGYDVNERFSVDALLASAGQCQFLTVNAAADDACRGAIPFIPQFSYRLTEQSLLNARFAFVAGNGLNTVSPFQAAPWAADLQDDVRDINGRGRNHLMTAWYQHNFTISPDVRLQATVGLIDSSEYLDTNLYSNDEYTQFMNSALVNNPGLLLPAYDRGLVLTWGAGAWTVNAVYMNVGKVDEEDDDMTISDSLDLSDSYNYLGIEAGYLLTTPLGTGNYRVMYLQTSNDFIGADGTTAEQLSGVLLSFDQSLGESLGAFIRFGAQSDRASIRYRSIYSGGLDISGNLWSRVRDNVGVGVAYLQGGNRSIDFSWVAETYYRMVFHDYLAVTGDLQYMRDVDLDGAGPEGFILGLRLVTQF
jgi:porin